MKLTTPTVTEWTYPIGFPMAHTHSPTLSSSEFPSGASGKSWLPGILSSATSIAGSLPTTCARNERPSARVTVIR